MNAFKMTSVEPNPPFARLDKPARSASDDGQVSSMTGARS